MTWAGSRRRDELPPDWELKYRLPVLSAANWLCEVNGPGCVRAATDVDHKKRGNDHSRSNLQAICRVCHGRKSAAEGVARRRELKARRKRPPQRHPGQL
ncbi:HNH endonuclease [Mycobacterium phage Jeffabunny]|uniref:HNH endonuclease n=12 Tax=Caudoviricetes TaxID=2731619 RepID=V5R4I7_9CAUD|nr:HNH endonuclease [Mycobacterium phage CloudWang3]YP_008858431.1 HNH endonuclease [Mycobacterium phage Artemis2UCLA]YP_008859114.1 HNH endonuclease [Mycobacterium phage Zaka]YP_009224129.1 HNH endonuclease [Mycobacterium phage VohminGhazi]YP_009637811.1 HNH endonuclease [Mycobacterium phage EricB]YP_009638178.1 HNH endonuclease [Mycobacterium phage Jeffabunny]YP_010061043.1 HNH endonuclease [Mycobacterium phage Blinn1]YP_010061231.1 HNH endonuclease [Mycobacterium phage Priamo]YP_01006132